MNGFCQKTEQFRQAYYRKSRKTMNEYSLSSMNSGCEFFHSYDIDWKKLIDTLVKESTNNGMISQDVKAIDFGKQELTLTDNTKLKYKKLISTIPAPAFFSLGEYSTKKLCSLPKHFILRKVRAHCWLKDFDFVYYAGKVPWHRVTRIPNCKDKAIFEYVGRIPAAFPNEIDRQTIQTGQILPDMIPYDSDNIKFLGRYAEWKHEILVNDVIKRVLWQLQNEKQ
jgi:hypothetical protein